MKHLSIEGMDGIGKSTTCKILEERLGYTFVEKPLHLLFDEGDSCSEYIRIRNQVNANPNRDFTALFYGLGSLYLYEQFKDANIITDRHLASNYAWSGVPSNRDVYELLIKKLGKPDLTVILSADKDTIISRLKSRDENDSDIEKADKAVAICEKMVAFCKEFDLPFMVIDTSHLSPEQVVERIIERWEQLWQN